MPISIKEIHVQDLGPISRFSMELGRFNLIYGGNERGKTYLVEFVIRSLFRTGRLWPLRAQMGRGKVIVAGVTNSGLTTFSPSSAKKLEDFWEEDRAGLPADFSKLLVVKGAEVELVNVEGGVDKAILKRLLSSKEILDKIQKNISKTIQETRLENGAISGPNRGEISARAALFAQYKRINQLFDRLDLDYSGGRREKLSEEREKLEGQIEQQVRAKQYLAFTLDQEIKRLRDQKRRIATDKIQEVKNKLSLYTQKVAEFRDKQHEQQEAEVKSKHFEWLKSAEAVYQDALKKEVAPPRPIFLILSLVFITAAGVLAFLNLPIFAALSLAAVIGFGGRYVHKYRLLASQAAELQELDHLKKEFYQLFNIELTGLPLLLKLQNNMEEAYNTARLLKKQLAEDFKDLSARKAQISEQIASILGKEIESKLWNEALRRSENELQRLDSQIREKELYLAKLGVDHSDFQSHKPGVEYSQLKLESLENTLKNVESRIDEETRQLTSLKQLICEYTGDDISIGWERLIDNLRMKRKEVLRAYTQKTAEIVGKLAVYTVLNNLRKAEDSKIVAGLRSKEVQEPLFQMTSRYNSLTLEDEKLLVGDAYHNFGIDEISTGAQEQVLLALRVGFSKILLGHDNLFWVLDDAFQYSDWARRKLLVDKVAKLAQGGWQIIYFTMDDNIRELFDHKGEIFGSGYKFVDLGA